MVCCLIVRFFGSVHVKLGSSKNNTVVDDIPGFGQILSRRSKGDDTMGELVPSTFTRVQTRNHRFGSKREAKPSFGFPFGFQLNPPKQGVPQIDEHSLNIL